MFDVDGGGDVVLQADKSAFKAKKMGGPLPGNKAGAKNGVRPSGLRDTMAQDTLDFNKKILHSSWHPREDTIAVSSIRGRPPRYVADDEHRLPRRTTCSYIVPREGCVVRTPLHALHAHTSL